MNTPRNASEAATLARIADRAAKITDDYRLIWDRHEHCFMVAHKDDRKRRYTVTSTRCSCPSFAKTRCCKHHLGLADVAHVEINRYKLLDFPADLERTEAFLAELENEEMWSDPHCLANLEEMFAA